MTKGKLEYLQKKYESKLSTASDAMKINYFADTKLIKEQSEKFKG